MFTEQNPEQFIEKVSGIIERITYHNEENGWSVIKVSPFESPLKMITVIIHQAQIIAGDTMDFFGNWTDHPKHGKQFKANQAVSRKPATVNALEKYLGSGLIFGVGPKTAHKIVKYFGQETLKVFDTEIERLMEVPSIGKSKLEMIKEAWEEHKAIKEVMIFLQSYGISTLYSVKIYKEYGNDAIKIVGENPYRLAKDIYGIGFFSADKIAKNLGFEADSPLRIEAGIKHVLAASRENGHCFLKKSQIESEVQNLLSLENLETIEKPLENLINTKEISTRLIENEELFYYANSLYWDEVHVSRRINKIINNKHQEDRERISQWVEKYTKKINMTLSEEQLETAISIPLESFSIITGGPGCGKTTTTKVIVKLFEAMNKEILLTAPTGRAAQRMTEVIGKEAITIHRLLKYNPREGKFEKNEENQLEGDVIIVDEVSMLDISLAASLLKAIPDKCRVIFIGDADQLPSVGAGNVLHDLLACKKIKHFSLTKIFRQAQQSLIITHAHEINSGKVPQIETPVRDNNLFRTTDCLFIDSEEATQEQLKFIKKARQALREIEQDNKLKVFVNNQLKKVINKNEKGEIKIYQTVKEIQEPYDTFSIPDRLKNANLNQLLKSKTAADELASVINQIPVYSTLNYGMTATESLVKLVAETVPKYYGNAEFQILCPMVRGSVGTININKLIQQKINPYREGSGQLNIGEKIIRVDDRVIQNVNNYDLGVYNGDIGKVIALDSQNYSCLIEFGQGKKIKYEKSDLTEIALAYAITIHKSQGSEFPIVIIPLLTQHFNMLFRNLVYTGLTRAKKQAIFVGSRKALAMAVNKMDLKERQTTLNYLLENLIE